MIEIPNPPTVKLCAACGSVSWLYSPKAGAWICVVPIDAETFRLHPCRHAQAAGTWRQLQTADPPSVEYLAAKAALGKTSTDNAGEAS